MLQIKRNLLPDIREHLKAKEITLIVGARQVGKSTLMQQLQSELETKGEKTILLNLDIEKDNKFFVSQSALMNKISLEVGNTTNVHVFIDEIQRKENAGLFLKGLYDMNLPYKFIVSGSGSLELKEKIHESLAGRKRMFELMPVSFSEYVNYQTEYLYEDRLDNFFALESEKTFAFLKEYLNFGGYPRVILEKAFEQKKKIINDIYQSYIEKDISYLLGIDRPDAFSVMLKILATQSGKLVQYSNLAQQSGISFATLKNYLWYAEKTFIIKLLTPYFSNRQKEILKSPLVHFNDHGFKNFSIDLFGSMETPLAFGFAFQEFIFHLLSTETEWSAQKIYFWRTTDGAEVDFVIHGAQSVLPIEVKFSHFKKPTVTRSLRNFIKKYSPPKAYVINLDYKHDLKIQNTNVYFLPYWELISPDFNL